MPGPRSMIAQVDAVRRRRRPRSAPGRAGGDQASDVGDDVGQRPLEQGRVGDHRRAACRARRPSTWSGRGRASRGPRRRRPRGRRAAAATVTAPACSRLMSSRLPTSRLSRSASVSIVSANSRRCSASHATSDWRRLVADALIEASGVRRSWLTAWSSAVRSSSASARWAATAASAWSRRDSQGEREAATGSVRSTRWSSARQAARPAARARCVPSSTRSQRVAVERFGRRVGARRWRRRPSRRRGWTAARRSGGRTWCAAGRAARAAGSGSPIRMPLVRASAPASARAWSASRLRRRDPVDEHAGADGGGHEDRERDDVLGVARS